MNAIDVVIVGALLVVAYVCAGMALVEIVPWVWANPPEGLAVLGASLVLARVMP